MDCHCGGLFDVAVGRSSVQIGGPAGAFIVIVYGIVERYGLANLFISTIMAGALLFAMGLFKLGNLVRYVPVSLVIGFTNGIAVLVALSQIKDALGLQVGKMPADFFGLLATVGKALPTANLYALALTLLCVGGLALWPRLWKSDSVVLRVLGVPATHATLKTASRIPGPVVAMLSLTLLAYALQLPVETIGSKFGGIPQNLPALALPEFSWNTVKMLVTPTLTIALLGAIESLLCARVGDQVAQSMHTGAQASPVQPHDPNQELMAQGIANMLVPFFCRRHARSRHHCPHRYQCAGGCARTRGRHGACRHPAGHCAAGCAPGLAHTAGRAGRCAAVCSVEHGRVARVCPA